MHVQYAAGNWEKQIQTFNISPMIPNFSKHLCCLTCLASQLQKSRSSSQIGREASSGKTVLIAKWEDLQRINKREKERRWETRIGRYIWQEKERKRETETGQINQGQYLQYLGLCSARNIGRREGGGSKKRRKEGESEKHLRECVQRERKHTHTRRLGSQSEC